MEWVMMSQQELRKVEVIRVHRVDIDSHVRERIEPVGACSASLSAKALRYGGSYSAGLSRQRMSLLVNAYRREGHIALVSRRRGKPANNRYSTEFQNRTLSLIREHYSDFGPTLAAEYLAERDGINVSRETLRKWIVDDGIWTTRSARRKRVQQRRQRRECRGELVQLDGSHHDWFEGRGDGKCCLLVYIDDATSELLHLEFVPSESTFSLMAATRRYVVRHGRLLALYTDKAGVFRNNSRSRTKGRGVSL